MKEIQNDIFNFVGDPKVDAICITTNGIVANAGYAIMGAGTAGEAASKWEPVKWVLGKRLQSGPNQPYIIGYLDQDGNYLVPNDNFYEPAQYIFSFPTKYHFKDKASVSLIKQSASKLVTFADAWGLKNIVIPAPGVGLKTGQLNWEQEVKPAIKDILDDRFSIVFLKGN